MNQSIQKRAELLESFLIRVDPIMLMGKIRAFRRLNIQDLSDEELFQAIQRTLLNDNYFSYMTVNNVYPSGTSFFRVRNFKKTVISEINFKALSDFWEPPTFCVTENGRLNKIGESLLYTSPGNPQVAVKEMHLQAEDWYALIKYTAVKEIKVNVIGGIYIIRQWGSLMRRQL